MGEEELLLNSKPARLHMDLPHRTYIFHNGNQISTYCIQLDIDDLLLIKGSLYKVSQITQQDDYAFKAEVEIANYEEEFR